MLHLFSASKSPQVTKFDILSSLFGVGAVQIMVTISGYSAIYFESMLKKAEKVSIWFEFNYFYKENM